MRNPKMSKTNKTNTTIGERNTMIEWLEIKENLQLVLGDSALNTPVVSGKKVKKVDAWKDLAAILTKRHSKEFTADQAKNRYYSIKTNYTKTIDESLKTGWGLNDKDMLKGILTLNDKLEAKCPFFQRLDVLFGDRQNVRPSSIMTSSSICCPSTPLSQEYVPTPSPARRTSPRLDQKRNAVLLFSEDDDDGPFDRSMIKKKKIKSFDSDLEIVEKKTRTVTKKKIDFTEVFMQESAATRQFAADAQKEQNSRHDREMKLKQEKEERDFQFQTKVADKNHSMAKSALMSDFVKDLIKAGKSPTEIKAGVDLFKEMNEW